MTMAIPSFIRNLLSNRGLWSSLLGFSAGIFLSLSAFFFKYSNLEPLEQCYISGFVTSSIALSHFFISRPVAKNHNLCKHRVFRKESSKNLQGLLSFETRSLKLSKIGKSRLNELKNMLKNWIFHSNS